MQVPLPPHTREAVGAQNFAEWSERTWEGRRDGGAHLELCQGIEKLPHHRDLLLDDHADALVDARLLPEQLLELVSTCLNPVGRRVAAGEAYPAAVVAPHAAARVPVPCKVRDESLRSLLHTVTEVCLGRVVALLGRREQHGAEQILDLGTMRKWHEVFRAGNDATHVRHRVELAE